MPLSTLEAVVVSELWVPAAPRLRVAPAVNTNDAADVVDLMAAYGTDLDPWQVDVLEGGLGVLKDGSWAAHTVGVNVSRQNGKSRILLARAMAGALLFGEQTIIVSAHEQRTSRLLFDALMGYFDNYDDLRRRVLSKSAQIGREELKLRGGARLLFLSRTRSTMRGFSIDCLLLDEAQLLQDQQWEAARPAMSARRGAVTWMAGTAPQQTTDAEVFGRLRASAIAGDNTDLAWTEYGADEGADLDDREQWRKANPGRVTVEAMEAERREMSPGGFARERLNIWPTDRTEQVIDGVWWAQLAGTVPAGVAPAALAVDMSPTRDAVAVAGAWKLERGWHVEVLLVGDPFVAAQFVVERAGRRIPVVVDGASAARSLEPTLAGQRVRVRVTTAAEMAVACGGFLDDVNAARLSHGGDGPLEAALLAAVEGARRRALGDGGAFGWDRRDGAVFLSPLVAVTLARFGAATGRPRTGKAMFA